MRSVASIHIAEYAFVHAFLYREVESHVLIAVGYAGNPFPVALLVVGFHLLHYRHRQVLQGCLGVAGHKLLAVHLYLVHRLSVDGDVSFVVNRCAWEQFHQFLYHRTLRRTVRCTVVDERVFHQRNLQSLRRSRHFLEHHGIRPHGDFAHIEVVVIGNDDVLHVRGISHT